MSSGVANAGFFEKLSEVVTSPVDVIEGGLWGLWFRYQVKQLQANLQEKANAEALSDLDYEKPDIVWKARKDILLKSSETVSAGAFVANWAGEVGLVNLGSFQPLVAGLGYLGSAICYPFKLWEALKELHMSSIDYAHTTSNQKKHEIGIKQCDMMLNVAMLTCFVCWGILGITYSFIGGETLFQIVDYSFLYGLILFVVKFSLCQFFPPATQKARSPS